MSSSSHPPRRVGPPKRQANRVDREPRGPVTQFANEPHRSDTVGQSAPFPPRVLMEVQEGRFVVSAVAITGEPARGRDHGLAERLRPKVTVRSARGRTVGRRGGWTIPGQASRGCRRAAKSFCAADQTTTSFRLPRGFGLRSTRFPDGGGSGGARRFLVRHQDKARQEFETTAWPNSYVRRCPIQSSGFRIMSVYPKWYTNSVMLCKLL